MINEKIVVALLFAIFALCNGQKSYADPSVIPESNCVKWFTVTRFLH